MSVDLGDMIIFPVIDMIYKKIWKSFDMIFCMDVLVTLVKFDHVVTNMMN